MLTRSSELGCVEVERMFDEVPSQTESWPCESATVKEDLRVFDEVGQLPTVRSLASKTE